MRALDVQGIQQSKDVVPQLLNAVRPRCHQGLAMAASVETQHTKVLGERRDLRVPHVQVGTQ
ncbi:hypothetical protein D3C84_1312270 [compost metagenome]